MKKLLMLILVSCCMHIAFAQDNSTPHYDSLFQSVFENVQFSDADIFLMSELHGSIANPYLQYHCIEKLQKAYGLRYILLEMPPSFAYLYNRFLNDEISAGALDTLVKDKRHNLIVLELVKSYNATLPQSNKLQFVGIDEAYNAYNPARRKESTLFVFSEFVKSLPITLQNKHKAAIANCIALSSKDKYLSFFVATRKMINSDKELKQYLLQSKYGLDFLSFFTQPCFAQKGGRRDDEIARNFDYCKNLYQLGANEKFFASFGASHVVTYYSGNLYNIWRKKYKVAIIGIQYINLKHPDRYFENGGIIQSFGRRNSRRNAIHLQRIAAEMEYTTQGVKFIADISPYQFPDAVQAIIVVKGLRALKEQ